MNFRLLILPATQLLCVVSFLTGCAQIPTYQISGRSFDFKKDRFAFANETVWDYAHGEVQHGPSVNTGDRQKYSRRCFVLTRAAVQFLKFARFDPAARPLQDRELAERIRQVTAIDVWRDPLSSEQRIVLPGYESLYAISKAHTAVFQSNIGLGWPVYFRPGNMCIVFPPDREDQTVLNGQIQKNLTKGRPELLWLVNFPSLSINHSVVVFAGRNSDKKNVYTVYDPNYCDAPKTLEYDPATQSFYYQPTFYFKGGRVDARAIYRGFFQ